MAEQPGGGGNVEYPTEVVCEWVDDQDAPCLKHAVARVVVGDVAYDVCEEHRRWLVGGHVADS
jgi:hypothetical protein